jgi:hypothetical protein
VFLQAFKLPEPAKDSFLLQVSDWTHTKESEDLEAERKLYYGTAGGSPFGARVSLGLMLSWGGLFQVDTLTARRYLYVVLVPPRLARKMPVLCTPLCWQGRCAISGTM